MIVAGIGCAPASPDTVCPDTASQNHFIAQF